MTLSAPTEPLRLPLPLPSSAPSANHPTVLGRQALRRQMGLPPLLEPHWEGVCAAMDAAIFLRDVEARAGRLSASAYSAVFHYVMGHIPQGGAEEERQQLEQFYATLAENGIAGVQRGDTLPQTRAGAMARLTEVSKVLSSTC